MDREIFVNGEYVRLFTPDDADNLYRNLYDAKRSDIIAAVVEHVPAGSRILDLGGGMGRMSIPLAVHGYTVTLADISDDMLHMAQQAAEHSEIKRDRLVLRQVDATGELPFATHSFDCALAVDLMIHLPDPHRALDELKRILAPDSHLFVDMSNSSPWWLLRYPKHVGRRPGRWLKTFTAGGVIPEWQHIVRHRSRREFLAMLATAELSVEQEWKYGPFWTPKWYLARCSTPRTSD